MVKVGGELFDKLFGTTCHVTQQQPLTLQMKCNDKLCKSKRQYTILLQHYNVHMCIAFM